MSLSLSGAASRFNIRWAAATALITLLSSSQTAGAGYMVCSRPNAPQPFLSTPHKPYCAQTKSCSQFDVETYRRQIDSYFADLKEYLRDVEEYRRDAYTYAKCMADID